MFPVCEWLCAAQSSPEGKTQDRLGGNTSCLWQSWGDCSHDPYSSAAVTNILSYASALCLCQRVYYSLLPLL